MEIGTVTGSVWATRKARELGGHTLLVVRTGTGKTVAADFVGAGAGDRVLLVCGSTARSPRWIRPLWPFWIKWRWTMSPHEILIAIMAAFAVLGALDRIFGNRVGLGPEF